MNALLGTGDLPLLVVQALARAEAHGFTQSCSVETGRLLRVLAAAARGRPIAEIGCGFGVGSAWLLSGAAPTTPFSTVDIVPERVSAVRELARDRENVTVHLGDWRVLKTRAPYALVFADGGKAKLDVDEVLELVEPGGVIIVDDLTPEELWLAEGRSGPDPVRDGWLGRSDVAGTEVRVRASESVIVAVRVVVATPQAMGRMSK